MNFNKPKTKLEWRHEYQYREDDRKVFRAMIAEDYPEGNAIPLIKFLGYMRSIWDAIPQEWRQHAFIKLGREDWECGTAADFDVYLDVYLERLETDEEFAARARSRKPPDEAAADRAQEARERGMLEALKKKYGE